MVTEYPNPLGGPSVGHTCAMPSSPPVPHVRLNLLPQNDFETWFSDQSTPCHTILETHPKTLYPDRSTPQRMHQND
jgi:hypothetical protein